MMDLNIFGTIKGLITNQIEIVGDDIRAVHAEIVAACLYMIESYVITVPQTLTCIGEVNFLGGYLDCGEKFSAPGSHCPK